jgi:hypothetical protein|tara:strand:+ start:59 stop:616 length:558 start_codon:yes stop_codon:yes gene_type:complete
MAEKNKKKKPVARGMPKTSIQSRMPSKAAKGQAGKVSKPKKKGLIASLKARRAKRASANKWVLGEKLTKAGRKRASGRKASKKLKKAGVTVSAKTARESGKVRTKGLKGAEVTKGGAYAKYEKKSKAAGSFRSARKKGCGSSEGGTFSWDGRSYSCGVAKPTKKQKSIRKAKALPGGMKDPRGPS